MEIFDTNLSMDAEEFDYDYRCKELEYGDLIVDILNRIGVEYVFGVPGGGIEPLYDAMARSERSGGLRTILARHESGAAFMADGYARETGKLGVCCTTTGPGATNILTGVAAAYVDQVPLLVLTGQTQHGWFGRGSTQDSSSDGVDIVSMFRHCTRYTSLVSHPDQLENKLIKAISIASSQTPGPCHLSIPIDLMRAPYIGKFNQQPVQPYTAQELLPNPNVMLRLNSLLQNSKKAVLVLGKGAEIGARYIIGLAEQKQWPIITTPMGKGLVSSLHPLYMGVYGLGGHPSADAVLRDKSVDLIIVVGSVLDETETVCWNPDGLINNKLIHIDTSEENFHRSAVAKLHVLGSPRYIFKKLLHEANESNAYGFVRGDGNDCYHKQFENLNNAELQVGENKLPPQILFHHLSATVPADTRIVVDIGNSFLWGIHYWQCRHEQGDYTNLFRLGLGYGSMGWGIGAAVGTAIANPEIPVVCFTGDGSLLMNGQEITVAIQERLNILFVVLNDQCLGTVKHGQMLANAEDTSHELPPIDFELLAKSYQLNSKKIKTVEELKQFDAEEVFAQRNGPFLLEVMIDPDQVPPMGARIDALNDED